MKSLVKIVFAIVLCIAIITVAVPATKAEAADVQITVTFAVGGVACGVYFFFAYSSSLTGDYKLFEPDSAALFNFGPEGWQVRPPLLQLDENHDKTYTPYAEILRIRF
jgi:hypothetical protein